MKNLSKTMWSHSIQLFTVGVSASMVLSVGCGGAKPSGDNTGTATKGEAQQGDEGEPGDSNGGEDPVLPTYSIFGDYVGMPQWSDWCGAAPDFGACAKVLQDAVSAGDPSAQTAASRPTVRGHGWRLWAGIWSALSAEGVRNDAITQKTELFGTDACWGSFEDGTPACSGAYPIWMSWPNTGVPYGSGAGAGPGSETGSETGTGGDVALAGGAAPAPQSLRASKKAFSSATPTGDPDPTKVQTVNTSPAPTYALPPLVLNKNCNIGLPEAKAWIDAQSEEANAKIQQACAAAGAPDVFCPNSDQVAAICDGRAFINQGDVMIATESLTREGYEDIQDAQLYSAAKLQEMYKTKDNSVATKLGNDYISTKHMFWPVKGCKPGAAVGSESCRVRYGALPPWTPKNFKHKSYATNTDYVGYEVWGSVVAIDTCDGDEAQCPKGASASLQLAHVGGASAITTADPEVYAATDFVHVQISREVLETKFTAADRALLDQATIWAYGDESQGFEAGDFLVVAAMHVTTKEVDTWAFQSVWWSPMNDATTDCPLDQYDHCFGQSGAYAATATPGGSSPNQYSGLSAADITALDAQVGDHWRSHYVLTDSYGIRYELDGTKIDVANYFAGTPPTWATTGPSGDPLPLLPVSSNVYIEPVIHPLGTNCQNCHRRAGSPETSCDDYTQGCGRSNYQTAQCPDLLGDYGDPAKDPCMMTPWAWYDGSSNHCKADDKGGTLCDGDEAFPVLNTDLTWILADNHIQER